MSLELSRLEPHRTSRQNRAMHKYFTSLAEILNDAGLDMRKTLKPTVAIPWTQEGVKTLLWHPIMEALTDKESTAELNTLEISQIYETLNRHLAEKFGISVEWPHEKG